MTKRNRVWSPHPHVCHLRNAFHSPSRRSDALDCLGGHLHTGTHKLPPYTDAHITENKNKP